MNHQLKERIPIISRMRVVKRDGTYQNVSFDKVLARIQALSDDLKMIDPTVIAQKVCSQIYDGVHTSELDELAGRICTSMMTVHPDFGILGSRIAISNNHKNTSPSFSETVKTLYENKDIHGDPSPLVADDFYKFVMENRSKINDVIDYSRDFNRDYFAFKTLERAYLIRVDNKVVERIQDMTMRVSLAIHIGDINKGLRSYDLMSRGYFTHATPTLFHAGTPHSQYLSCFLTGLVGKEGDSIKGIYHLLGKLAQISKYAGGIGTHVHDVRSAGARIHGTNGTSNGLVPMLRVFNNTARYVDQGGGKRKGSIAIYLAPHHPDIMEFLDLRKNHGNEEDRCRDLFTALWVSDLFMKRVKAEEMWSLFDPSECPGLSDIYGDEFEALYLKYEEEGRYRKQIPAQTIWRAVIESQIETGTPYISYKDHANRKSNQKNIGTIRSSNLCVVPETQVLTDLGYERIDTLAKIGTANVWNGIEFSESVVKKTGENQKIIKVVLSDFSELECTPYHKFYLNNGETVEAKDLKVGDKLIECETPEGVAYNGTITAIIDEGRISDTYCFTEPKRNLGFFNGIPAGNCNEIYEVSDNDEYACCTLASVALSKFVEKGEDGVPFFNHELFHEVLDVVVENLNNVIELNFYPVPETKISNMRHRPLGIGVQGLYDTFVMMGLPFDSDGAKALNREIFESMYYGAMKASVRLAERDGPYETFEGSPLSQGLFQFDLWGVKPEGPWDWEGLREKVMSVGARNSLLIALMPTASTSQILGNVEAFEMQTNNIYARRTLAGDFAIVNKYLSRALLDLGLWTPKLKDMIIKNGGSIQNIDGIPDNIKELFKTVWEIKQRHIVQMSAERGPFICQSQSMNLYFEDPTFKKLSSAHFYGWQKGLKTGSYYIRSRAKVKPQAFTIEPEKVENEEVSLDADEEAKLVCSLTNREACMMCSS